MGREESIIPRSVNSRNWLRRGWIRYGASPSGMWEMCMISIRRKNVLLENGWIFWYGGMFIMKNCCVTRLWA